MQTSNMDNEDIAGKADARQRQRAIMRVTTWGAVVNCALTLAKLATGIVGHSAAMVADGVHSLSDLVSDFIVILFVRISSKGEDSGHDYGHGKFETLATLMVSMLLMAVGVQLMVMGVRSVCRHVGGAALPLPSMATLFMALLSIVTKELLYQFTCRVGRRVDSPVVIANAWHHRTDAISSVGSLVGIAGAIFLGRQWVVLDALAACIISLFIFFIALRMAGAAIGELMEAALPEAERREICQLISKVDGILDVHNLKTRRNGPSVIIDVHIVVNPQQTVAEAHDMTIHAERLLQARFGKATQTFIHIEPSVHAL